MSLNKMMIIGNLGADPELRYTPSGKAVTNLRVAVNSNRRGPDGEWVEETLWLRVEVWDQAAERVAEQLRKGNRIYAEGELRVREYDRNDGTKGTSVEMRFARVLNLERRGRDEEGGAGSFGSQDGPMDAPVARQRAPEQGSAPSRGDAMDVDDIPF
jgi:single-strand DNA-binding protein